MAPPICYKSHLSKQREFLDCSQLLKTELNVSLPMTDTTKSHGIYECYHIKDLCITTVRDLDHHGCWFCEFLSPCRLVHSVILIY